MDLSNLSTDDVALAIGYEVLRRMSAEKRLADMEAQVADATAQAAAVVNEIEEKRRAKAAEGPAGA